MSVWLNATALPSPLTGSEGALMAVSVPVAPRYLEEALDALAALSFPINPQIYHEAVSVYRYEDGREEIEPTTIVEFPAYESRLTEIRRVLEARGFDARSLHVADMLADIHADAWVEPPPPGAAWLSRVRHKHGERIAAHA
ncbi:MAG TPA: hypothetical protein VFA33_13255 [Bryobacteraceae bacterium]|nr:hypothetical protein [Bryobacteraceae bacterium]